MNIWLENKSGKVSYTFVNTFIFVAYILKYIESCDILQVQTYIQF
jgi:hypothetical protein